MRWSFLCELDPKKNKSKCILYVAGYREMSLVAPSKTKVNKIVDKEKKFKCAVASK